MALEHPVTLWLSPEDHAALVATAARYREAPEERVRAWIAEPLAEARKHWTAEQWEKRRRVLERDVTLAATVDAQVRGR